MILTTRVIVCGNEHGIGDQTFPLLREVSVDDFGQFPPAISTLRKRAKEAGWGRVNGEDYCPGCMESMRGSGT